MEEWVDAAGNGLYYIREGRREKGTYMTIRTRTNNAGGSQKELTPICGGP